MRNKYVVTFFDDSEIEFYSYNNELYCSLNDVMTKAKKIVKKVDLIDLNHDEDRIKCGLE